MKITITPLSVLIILIFVNKNSFAQDSIINTVLESRKSIVHIKAIQTGLSKSPNASAAFDPKSGKILLGRKMRLGYFEKTGAGVIINKEGLIVTNVHTIFNASKILVKLHNNDTFAGKILHIMPNNDLALIKIDALYPLMPIEFANSDNVNLGDSIINIGTSSLLKETISGGRITRIGSKNIGNHKNIEVIQVNINLYKGDSGGPLLNDKGQLIGMMIAKFKSRDKSSLAIPSNKIKKLYLDFVK